MHGLSVPSFLPTKKNPAPTGVGVADDASRQRVLDICLHGLTLWLGEAVETARREHGTGEELNSSLIGAVRW